MRWSVVVCLVLAGCPDDEPADPDGGVGIDLCQGLGPNCEADRDPPPGRDEACSFRQVIALAADGEVCPVLPIVGGVENWEGGALFRAVDAVPRPDDGDGEQRFCRYRYLPPGEPPADEVAALTDLAAIDTVEWDCHVTSGMGLFEELAPRFAARFDTMVGALPPGELFPRVEVAAPAPGEPPIRPAAVHVAVIDTAPAADPPWGPGAWSPGMSPHGRDMGRIIQRLACPGCADAEAEVRLSLINHAGLDLRWDDGQVFAHRDGGYFGRQGTVGERIYEAFLTWRTVDEPRPPLVINLSIGWDPLFNADDEGAPNALRARAVREAIELAVREGALVVASAGNRSTGPDEGGGLLWPAGLEAEELSPVGAAAYRPLVHAVGGLDDLDQPLANTRPGGMPRLASYALVAVAGELDGGDPSGPYTGSSVAAAVGAAAAAVVWRYLPELPADEVMQRVYDSAVDLGVPATVCHPGTSPCPNTRRISVCAAARAARATLCERDPEAPGCAGELDCQPPQAGEGEGSVDPVFPAELAVGFDDVDASEVGGTPQDVTGCEVPIVTGPTSVGEDPCPDQQHHGWSRLPWLVWPQPSNPGCHVCALSESLATLWYEPGEWPSPLTSPKLVVETAGGDVRSLDLAVGGATGGLEANTLYKFTGLKLPKGIKTAKLVFTTQNTAGNPISGGDQLILY